MKRRIPFRLAACSTRFIIIVSIILLLTSCSQLAAQQGGYQIVPGNEKAITAQKEAVLFENNAFDNAEYVSLEANGINAYVETFDYTERPLHGYIFTMDKINGAWGEKKTASFSNPIYSEGNPFLSPDGHSLYFYSTKPYDNKTNDYDIWITTQIEGGWGPPVNLEAINSSSWEFSPSISARGTLVFNSERPGGKGQADIYQSEYKDGKLGIPTPIEPLNSKLADAFPYIAEDESFILFSRYNRFLYISYNNNGNWTAPQAIVIKFPDQDNKEDFQLISPMILPDQHTKLLFIKYFPAANQKVAYTIDLADIGIQWTDER